MTFTATFFIGVPDNHNAKIKGIGEDGNLIYSLSGNAQFHHYLNIAPENKNISLVMPTDEMSFQLKKADIIINCITDPDSNGKSLRKLVSITDYIKKHYPKIAIFNDPARVFATSRDKIYQQYHNLPGIHIPKMIRITPSAVEDVVRSVHEQTIGYPFLIRSCGSHQSRDLQLITSPDHHRLLEYYAYDGTEYYLSSFVDYKSKDGLYRKARLLFIGNKLYPRHYMTSSIWEVHSNADKPIMAQNILEEERFFVQEFRSILHPDTLTSFRTIYQSSGLDYLGFDFAVKPDGTALIFEINPAQNAFIPLKKDDPSYLPFIRKNIINGLNEAIAHKLYQLPYSI